VNITYFNKKRYLYLSIFFSILSFLYRLTLSHNVDPIFGRFDSPSYFNFVFVGGIRMPLITLIFSTINDLNNIIIFQSIIAALAWTSLALVIYLLNFDERLIFIFSILILSLGLSKQIVYLDSCIDSESLNISFLVILISTILLKYLLNNNLSNFLLILSCILFAGIKSINALIIIIPLGFILLQKIRTKNNSSLVNRIIVLLAVFISTLSLYLFSNIQTTQILNTSGIINARLWKVESWKEYALRNGYPIQARSIYVRFTNQNLGLAPDTAVAKQPDFQKWYEDKGNKFLLKFMLSHPDYTFLSSIALPIFIRDLNFGETIWRAAAEGILYYESRQHALALKTTENYLFWSVNRSSGYIQIGIFLILIALSLRTIFAKSSAQFKLQSALLFLISITFFNSYLSWWFGSTPSDMGRHQFPFSVSLRIIALLSALLIFQNLINKFKTKSSN
jgi:hypothetical protein